MLSGALVKTKIYQDLANTNIIEKNEHIRYCSIYIFTGHICDCNAGKVEISCVIRGDSQRKINVLHDILPCTFSKKNVIVNSHGNIFVK